MLEITVTNYLQRTKKSLDISIIKIKTSKDF